MTDTTARAPEEATQEQESAGPASGAPGTEAAGDSTALAKEVADLVATTDGIIFHLWSHDDKVPSGQVIVAQSVGHVKLTQAELKKGALESAAAKASGK